MSAIRDVDTCPQHADRLARRVVDHFADIEIHRISPPGRMMRNSELSKRPVWSASWIADRIRAVSST